MAPANPPASPGGSRPGKADWRGGAKGAARGRATGDRGAGWRESPDLPYERSRRWHRARLAVLGLTLLSCLALFAWLVLWRPVKTPLLAMAVIDYAHGAFPPNAWALEDARRFAVLNDQEIKSLLGERGITDHLAVDYDVQAENPKEGFHELRRQTLRAKGGGPDRKALIVYLSMHGAVNEKGQPCLIPPRASPLDTSTWVPLVELLEYLFPRDARLPSKKLVVLDCNRIDACWPAGVLANGFADHLAGALEEADIPGLALINSTSPGQAGWTSPEKLGGSVFGYFVWRGLMGWADREAAGNHDGQVSLEELYQYVREGVQTWVRDQRADVQVPLLVTRDVRDFGLVYALPEDQFAEVQTLLAGADSSATESTSPAPGGTRGAVSGTAADPRWQRVARLWRMHEELARKSPWQADALAWARFRQGLRQLEDLIVAGSAYEERAGRVEKELGELAARLSRDRLTAGLPAFSVPLARRFSGNAESETEAARLIERWKAAPGKFPLAQGTGELPLAQAIWDWCVVHASEGRMPGAVLALAERAAVSSKAARCGPIEMLFVRALDGAIEPAVREANPDLLRRALLARAAAEGAAAPQDERAGYWLQRSVDEADAARREAEDALFVGDGPSLRQADQQLAAAAGPDGKGGKYQEAQERAERVARAYATRDSAFEKTPYLARWLLARSESQSDPAPIDKLETLIGQTQELARALDQELKEEQGETPRAASGLPLWEKSRAAVEKLLTELEGAYLERCRELVKQSGEDRQVLRRLHAVLSVPLTTGDPELRNRLRARWLSLADTLAATAPLSVGASDGKVEEDAASTAWLRWARPSTASAPWREHPTLRMAALAASDGARSRSPAAGSDVQGEPDSRHWAREGGRLRALLGAVEAKIDQYSAQTEAKLKLEERVPWPGEVREGYSQADCLARSCASLRAQDESATAAVSRDPITQLRKLDLHYLLLWQSYRVLSDFWGRAGEETGGLPFFAAAAGGYLEAARNLCPLAASRRYRGVALEALLSHREAAAPRWLEAKVEDPRILTADAPTPVKIEVELAKDLPTGRAALWLESVTGRQPLPLFSDREQAASQGAKPTGRLGIDVVPGRGERTAWIRSDDERLASRNFEAVSWFRGHRELAPFSITPYGAGLQIAFEPPQELKSTVTVRGRLMAESYVIFILDYSASMLKTVSEAGQGDQYRYAMAREVLVSFLERLSRIPDNPYRVGVMLYGHRRCWANDRLIREYGLPATTRTVKWEYKNGWRLVGADDDFIDPDRDVEMIWPPLWPPRASLGKQDTDQVKDLLRTRLPTGVTPLYLSILDAVHDLEKLPSRSAGGVPVARQIVAITDGINYQQMLPGDQRTEALQVRDALTRPENRDIRLDVVGFLLPERGPELEQALGEDAKSYNMSVADIKASYDELGRLAAQAHGGFHSVMAPTRMTEKLEETLRLSRYAVHRDGTAAEPALRELNEPWPIALDRAEVARSGGLPYVASVPSRGATARVVLSGLEAVQLWLSDDEKRLVHRRYEDGLRQFRENVVDPLDAQRRLFVAAHLPTVKGNRVEFYFSVQNQAAEQFSARPVESWVEIRPVLPAGAKGPLYLFYDMQYKPDCPVPVLQCAAPDWPEAAEEADVQLACKFARTPPEQTTAAEETRTLTFEGATLEIRPQPNSTQGQPRIVVLERLAAGAELNGLKVEVVPEPVMAVHQYIPEAGIVRHTFTLAREGAARGASPAVRVTSRRQALKDAVSVPLRVRIPRNPVGGGL